MSWFRPSCSTEVGAGHMSPLNFLVIHVLHVFFVVVVLLGLWALPCTRLALKQLGFCCLLAAVCPPARPSRPWVLGPRPCLVARLLSCCSPACPGRPPGRPLVCWSPCLPGCRPACCPPVRLPVPRPGRPPGRPLACPPASRRRCLSWLLPSLLFDFKSGPQGFLQP